MPNNKIGKTSPGSRVLLAASVILIVGYGIYNWTVSPQTSYLQAARLYETMVANAGERTEMIKKQVGTKETEIVMLQREFSESRDSFFTAATAREFFSDLEPISLQCNCSIESLNFTTAVPVSAKEAIELMRHSDNSLTAGTYTHLDYETLAAAINKFPKFEIPPQKQAKTGTDDVPNLLTVKLTENPIKIHQSGNLQGQRG